MIRDQWANLSRLDTSLSLFDRIIRLAQWGVVAGGGYIAALLAKADPLLKELGWIYWYFVGLLASLILVWIWVGFKSAASKQASADYFSLLSAPKSLVNPLQEVFSDIVIPVEDLKLPIKQLHSKKHFRRCIITGPGSVAIQGGSYVGIGFYDCGDIVALPNHTYMTGMLVLQNCTLENCQFVRVSVFADQISAKGLADIQGAKVVGLT